MKEKSKTEKKDKITTEKNDKNSIKGAIIWDILIMLVTLMLSTINNLTYIFTAASVVLLYPIIKDINRYKKAENYSKKIYNFSIVGGLICFVSLLILISLVATNKIIFTYVLYGVASPTLLVSIIFAINDYIQNKKNKAVIDKIVCEERTFDVEELGKSTERKVTESNKKTDIENNGKETDKTSAKEDIEKSAENLIENENTDIENINDNTTDKTNT